MADYFQHPGKQKIKSLQSCTCLYVALVESRRATFTSNHDPAIHLLDAVFTNISWCSNCGIRQTAKMFLSVSPLLTPAITSLSFSLWHLLPPPRPLFMWSEFRLSCPGQSELTGNLSPVSLSFLLAKQASTCPGALNKMRWWVYQHN